MKRFVKDVKPWRRSIRPSPPKSVRSLRTKNGQISQAKGGKQFRLYLKGGVIERLDAAGAFSNPIAQLTFAWRRLDYSQNSFADLGRVGLGRFHYLSKSWRKIPCDAVLLFTATIGTGFE